jgi:hypothetical protein
MPVFKTTHNILKRYDEDELYTENWMDSNTLVLPPKIDWDYNREMIIEDVDIWEVLYEGAGGKGVYAAWLPYAEFYMVTTGTDERNGPRFDGAGIFWDRNIEVFYGPGAGKQVFARSKELGMSLNIFTSWVEDDKLWLHQ